MTVFISFSALAMLQTETGLKTYYLVVNNMIDDRYAITVILK